MNGFDAELTRLEQNVSGFGTLVKGLLGDDYRRRVIPAQLDQPFQQVQVIHSELRAANQELSLRMGTNDQEKRELIRLKMKFGRIDRTFDEYVCKLVRQDDRFRIYGRIGATHQPARASSSTGVRPEREPSKEDLRRLLATHQQQDAHVREVREIEAQMVDQLMLPLYNQAFDLTNQDGEDGPLTFLVRDEGDIHAIFRFREYLEDPFLLVLANNLTAEVRADLRALAESKDLPID
ncbi:unnamed protein product [Linum tenue]|uniref:Uncharacterized protein n=1 Tax=Linum tenue TaxID=586396 RepID=A0AAV0M1I9_9ROSI|nr:unnamed protein product [Linum tenue]